MAKRLVPARTLQKMRIGKLALKVLRKAPMYELGEKIRRMYPELPTRIILATETYEDFINAVTDEINQILRYIKKMAEKDGLKLYFTAKSCGISRCGTCMGVNPWHYPYVDSYDVTSKKMVRWSVKDMRDLFRRYLTESQLRTLETLCSLRHGLLQVRNYGVQLSEFVGLIVREEYVEV